QPDVIYAAIELDRRKGGVYRSTNRGASWTKMSDEVSGGTGPHYYQELYACPHRFDRIYLVSNYLVRSDNGGKSFERVNVKNKHVDDHAIAFRANDPNYLLVGTDGGLYESFDDSKTWRYVSNLPVTQFYKVAVDDAQPFYNVYGGTQDNNTQGGPSRTDNIHGIQNSDWFVVLGGDGHQPATEPGNPNIVYAQWQQGNLMRHDRRTGENVYIQPMAAPDEPAERWNWDAPIVVSPHNPAHLYFASQRVWKSTDRGDSWETLSEDLTTNTERIETPFFGTTQGWDNPWDIYAMSNYSTITSLGVSPVQQGLIYAGTDDGLIQVTEDEGKNWRKIRLNSLPGLPSTAFVNDIKADLHNANKVYAVFDNHKFGDYTPYLYKSVDKGKSWTKITNDLPDRTLLWRIVQDHENPELLFLGAEFGVYFSHNGGKNWKALKGGLPPIAVRDLAIQQRENDLVLATFGRGFYILDDYSALRKYNEVDSEKEALLYPPRDGWWYKPQSPLGSWGISQGDQHYMAPNPPFGVEFTYLLHEVYKSTTAKRKEIEKKRKKENQPLSFPGWEAVETEMREQAPRVWLFVTDEQGDVIRRVEATNSKGYQRVVWDLKKASRKPVLNDGAGLGGDSGNDAAPGVYFAQLFSDLNGELGAVSDRVEFVVKPLREGTLRGVLPAAVVAFQDEMETLFGRNSTADKLFSETQKSMNRMAEAYRRSGTRSVDAERGLQNLRENMEQFDLQWYGSKARREVGEKEEHHSLGQYLYKAAAGGGVLTYGPTATQRQAAEYASQLLSEKEKALSTIRENMEQLGSLLKQSGVAHWEIH
ncbi:MAG: glycosyl hydrolase, partial [Cryomorphaceae bacterium]